MANKPIMGTQRNDTLIGTAGMDEIHGLAGNDLLLGSDGIDRLFGGKGDDTFKYSSLAALHRDYIWRLDIGDKIDFSAITGLSFVGVGNSFTGVANQIELFPNGRLGIDFDGNKSLDYWLDFPYDVVVVETEKGSNIFQKLKNEKSLGTTASDTLIGSNANDIIIAGAGNDSIVGGYGYNKLYGRDGNDTLVGGITDDYLSGGSGYDVLVGGEGVDHLYGGAGNDVFKYNSLTELGEIYNSDAINDLAIGDKIDLSAIAGLSFVGVGGIFSGISNQVEISNTALSIDTNGDKLGDLYLYLNHGLFIEETARGSNIFQVAKNQVLNGSIANNTLTGRNGCDTLNGLKGNDSLQGGYGNDSLNGGIGDDVLVGGTGEDYLTGGDGNDIFKFIPLIEFYKTYYASDVITDFATGDKIDLSSIDANSSLQGDQAFSLIGVTAFSGIAGELQYKNGRLAGDINGDGRTDFYITLIGSPILTIADFML